MTGIKPIEQREPGEHSSSGRLTCQWCSVQLPAGVTRCPTCGSPGIPDPSMTVPGIDLLESGPVADPVKPAEELDEWWLDDESGASTAAQALASTPLPEDQILKTVGILVAAALIFGFIGWLAGPLVLAPAMEDITGSPVEHLSDLRPMGAVLGLITGLFFGACVGWINSEPARTTPAT